MGRITSPLSCRQNQGARKNKMGVKRGGAPGLVQCRGKRRSGTEGGVPVRVCVEAKLVTAGPINLKKSWGDVASTSMSRM